MSKFNPIYARAGIALPETIPVGREADPRNFAGALVLAPPSADKASWTRRFRTAERAYASGWMQIRGNRRRRSLDRGFVLSDHADWDGLLDAAAAGHAEQVWVTHGFAAELAAYLNEQGRRAGVLDLADRGESDETGA